MKKDLEILKYSNPSIVQQQANKYLGEKIYISTRKDKKYMVKNPEGKWIHFGQFGYEDYTKHKDENRRDNFRRRNAKWSKAEKYSPSWLSYWILW
jgi:hypothetical protein